VVQGAPVTTDSEFINTPNVTTTVSAEYSTTLGNTAQWVSHIDYIHKSAIQYDSGNSPLVAQDPYGLLNARLTLALRNSGLSFFLFGTNLTNSHYALGGIDDGAGGSLGEVIKLMGPPRQWGFGAQYQF
jgi:iron complex outermembrane receptor protein